MKTTTAHHATTPRPVQVWATIRDELRERREARREYRALARDLATYTTRSEVDDLLALVGDENTVEAQQIRRILAQNLQGHDRRHQLAS
jgi:hypothetical protein